MSATTASVPAVSADAKAPTALLSDAASKIKVSDLELKEAADAAATADPVPMAVKSNKSVHKHIGGNSSRRPKQPKDEIVLGVGRKRRPKWTTKSKKKKQQTTTVPQQKGSAKSKAHSVSKEVEDLDTRGIGPPPPSKAKKEKTKTQADATDSDEEVASSSSGEDDEEEDEDEDFEAAIAAEEKKIKSSSSSSSRTANLSEKRKRQAKSGGRPQDPKFLGMVDSLRIGRFPSVPSERPIAKLIASYHSCPFEDGEELLTFKLDARHVSAAKRMDSLLADIQEIATDLTSMAHTARHTLHTGSANRYGRTLGELTENVVYTTQKCCDALLSTQLDMVGEARSGLSKLAHVAASSPSSAVLVPVAAAAAAAPAAQPLPSPSPAPAIPADVAAAAAALVGTAPAPSPAVAVTETAAAQDFVANVFVASQTASSSTN